MKIIKRDGTVVEFNSTKIVDAIVTANKAVAADKMLPEAKSQGDCRRDCARMLHFCHAALR